MALAKGVREDAGVNRTRVIAVLEKYAGDDPNEHFWFVTVGAHGAQYFTLHDQSGAA